MEFPVARVSPNLEKPSIVKWKFLGTTQFKELIKKRYTDCKPGCKVFLLSKFKGSSLLEWVTVA